MGQEDTFTEITPVPDNDIVTYYLGVMIPEVAKFPFSFYARFKIMTFKFCGSVILKEEGRYNTGQKKYFNWYFMVEQQKTQEEIINHFLRVLCFNMLKDDAKFHDEWTKLNPPKKRDLLEDPEERKANEGYINDRARDSILEDQFETFIRLLKYPCTTLKHPDEIVKKKAKLMKKKMQKFDEEGIDNKFWSDRAEEELERLQQ